MALKAVLFDMDGVIVNSEPLHRKAFHQVFADLNIHVSQETYYSFSGSSTRNIAEKLVEGYGLDQTPDDIIAAKRSYFKELFANDTEFNLLPGVLELIQHYHQAGIKLVVASSASRNTITMVFDKFGLNPYFIGRISGDELEASKPDPQIFLQAAALAGEPVENCMVIEDATNGIIAAHRAGIFCAAYRSPHTHLQDYSLAQLVISDYQELRLEAIGQYFDR